MFLKNTICIFKNFSTIAEQKIWIYQNFETTLEHTYKKKKLALLPLVKRQVFY